jgi:hypothetical protein
LVARITAGDGGDPDRILNRCTACVENTRHEAEQESAGESLQYILRGHDFLECLGDEAREGRAARL